MSSSSLILGKFIPICNKQKVLANFSARLPENCHKIKFTHKAFNVCIARTDLWNHTHKLPSIEFEPKAPPVPETSVHLYPLFQRMLFSENTK